MKSLEAQYADVTARYASLRSEADDSADETMRLRARLLELEPQLSRSEKMREALALESSRQAVLASERDAELQRLLTLRREESERFHDRLSSAAARENESGMRAQALTAARLDAEAALRAARAELEATSRELAALRETHSNAADIARTFMNSDQLLRQAIARLGRELANGPGASEASALGEAEIIAFGRRDAVSMSGPENDRSNSANLASEA